MLGFVHIEKTAGMSINRIFQRSWGSRYCIVERWSLADDIFSAADYRKLRVFYPRLLGLGGHWIKPYGDLRRAIPDLRYFTFLREPLARCASHYQHQRQRMGRAVPFEEWVGQPEYRNFQTRKLVGCEDADAAIAVLEKEFLLVGLVDRFDETLVLLRRLLGPGLRIAYERENVAEDATLKKSLLEDPASRALLEDANRVDLEVYDWVQDRLYPRQRRAYGPELDSDVASFRAGNRVASFQPRFLEAQARRALLYKPAVQVHRRLLGRATGSRATPASGA